MDQQLNASQLQPSPEMPQPMIPESMQPPKKTKVTLSVIFIAAVILALGTGVWVLTSRNAKMLQSQNPPTNSISINSPNTNTTNTTTIGSGSMTAKKGVFTDLKALPLGDQKISTSPKVGYIYTCQTQFSTNAAGAQVAGSWIHGTTWDATAKLHVMGSVSWPTAVFTLSTSSSNRMLVGNGLPVNETTGIFPIQSNDPAYAVDRNPSTIKAQQYDYQIPLNPAVASAPRCVSGGMIGVALDGVAIFDGLDAAGRDAAAHEVFDTCDGHPQQEGMYHYHGPSNCMNGITDKAAVVGYAIDGYPITGLYDENGNEWTNEDLDACHGTTSPITLNGKTVTTYHYVMTREYPYSIGCFKGTPITIPHSGNDQGGPNSQTQSAGPSGQMPLGHRPPPPSGNIPPPGQQPGANNY